MYVIHTVRVILILLLAMILTLWNYRAVNKSYTRLLSPRKLVVMSPRGHVPHIFHPQTFCHFQIFAKF